MGNTKNKGLKYLEPTPEEELSPEEARVLEHWRNGCTMTQAYKKVMLTSFEAQHISKETLNKRVVRFFDTFRMRVAMMNTPGRRGDRAKMDFIQWKRRHARDIIKYRKKVFDMAEADREIAEAKLNKLMNGEDEEDDDDGDVSPDDCVQDTGDADGGDYSDESAEPVKERTVSPSRWKKPEPDDEDPKTSQEKWLESLNINENAQALTIYGTGQYIIRMAVKEMQDRQNEIRARGISVLDKNGSVFTSNIISAFKTAAAMILPFAPAPTAEDRRQMSKAAVLLGLIPDKIKESPDDYVAPPPAPIDVETEKKE